MYPTSAETIVRVSGRPTVMKRGKCPRVALVEGEGSGAYLIAYPN